METHRNSLKWLKLGIVKITVFIFVFKYTPVVQKEGQNGAVFVIPFGRPIKAVDQKELEKKMKNRRSALEARKRQKLREEKLQAPCFNHFQLFF